MRNLPYFLDTWAVKINDVDHTYGEVHEMMHADISIGNNYRLERIKLLILIATAVFGFTVTFHKDMLKDTLTSCTLFLVLSGWLFLLLSLIAGVRHLTKWEDFYLEHRAVANALWRYRTAPTQVEKDDAVEKFEAARGEVENFRKGYKHWNVIQFGSLVAGMALLAAYVGVSSYQTIR